MYWFYGIPRYRFGMTPYLWSGVARSGDFLEYHPKITNSSRIATSCHTRSRIYLSFRALARNLLNNSLNYY